MPLDHPVTHLEGFFQAIVEDAQNPDQWLIYSDWLEDHDDLDAEITRLWAEARLKPGVPSKADSHRIQQLFRGGSRPKLPRFENSIGMELLFIPRGTFWMSSAKRNAQQEVTLASDFWLGVYPTTQREWESVLGENPSFFSRTGGGRQPVESIPVEDLSRLPVESISWDDCQLFLQQLNNIERERGWTYRLPTEAEWEYACRGAVETKSHCSFHFYFDQPTRELSSSQANFDGERPFGNAPKGRFLKRTTKVGSFTPNALGIFDMHGNVSEFCAGPWNPEMESAEGGDRVSRGGGWNDDGLSCRAAHREWWRPFRRGFTAGLRVVLARDQG